MKNHISAGFITIFSFIFFKKKFNIYFNVNVMSEFCSFWVEVGRSNSRRSNQKIETLFWNFDQKILKALGGHYFRVFSYFTSPNPLGSLGPFLSSNQIENDLFFWKRGLLILGNLTLRSLPQLLIVALFFTYIHKHIFPNDFCNYYKGEKMNREKCCLH